MITKFNFKVRKMNSRGVGFIGIPKEYRNRFSKNDTIKVTIFKSPEVIFYAKIIKQSYLGLYVPASIAIKNKLHNNTFQISLEKTEGFFSKLGGDGRLYLPNTVGSNLNLKIDEVILLVATINNKVYSQYCLVRIREKENTTEYFCMFNPKLEKKEGIFQIKDLTSRRITKINDDMRKILEGFNYAQINETKLIVFYGNRVPIIINKDIKIEDFTHYLGCFFSDGTKRGNSWGIVASTFEQANFFISNHNALIKNNRIVYELSFSRYDYQNESKITQELINIWNKKTGINLDSNKIRLRKIEESQYSKRNLHGSLVMKENKQLSLIFYNRLLENLFHTILTNGYRNLAIDFILGCFEGDGAVSSKTHAHIVLTTNNREYDILIKLAKVTGINFKAHTESNPPKYYLRFHSLSILSNLNILKDKIFRYYPKRRRIFIERFLQIGATRYILGKQNSTSGWIKSYLQKEDILDKDYNLTEKGIKIKEALVELEKEIIKK